MLFFTGYFQDHSSFRVWAFDVDDLGQPIVGFVCFSLLSGQQREQAGEGVNAEMFVLSGEAQSSAFKSEAVSDFMSVAGTTDCFNSDDQSFHDDFKMIKNSFQLKGFSDGVHQHRVELPRMET
jgi:hypothetical protein